MNRLFTLALALLITGGLSAQNNAPLWKSVALDDVRLTGDAERAFEPYEYSAFILDYDALLAQLATAPRELSAAARSEACIVLLPREDGRIEPFAMYYSPVMPDQLAAKYPLIRTYTGYSLNDPGTKVKCSYSPEWGFKALVRRSDKGIEYVERLAKGQNTYYMAYDRLSFPSAFRTNLKVGVQMPPGYEPTPRGERYAIEASAADRGGLAEINPIKLKIYRFACATTGEFSQDHGGTTASVLAAMVDYTNQLNAIYEGDLDIRLILVDGVENILFLDPNTDPYTGTTVGDWMSQNPSAMVTHLGSADKYDIGHVFARYQGGNAVGVAGGLCCTQFKGRGCSAGNLPYGDYFLSVVGQEIGHQWEGWHSWNHCGDNDEPFPDTERCEPGSGSTIMSYAGACGGDNIQSSSDLYYHICSIKGIRNFVENGTGNTCGTEEMTTNNAPVVTIPIADDLFVPISTPFELNGSAVDPDGDPLTYNWDEIDLGPRTALGSPVANSPLFRSLAPGTATNRVFPRIQSIVGNTSSLNEILPTYTRDLTFCLVARDNQSGGGGVGVDTLSLHATASAGPFLVTYPNTNTVTWKQGEYQIVTWDVANTDKAPVNCHNVNVRMSKNSGFDYQYTLASNVPNTGRACVLVPSDVATSALRIRVEAADNVFFDISNANFKIVAPSTPGFSLCTPDLDKQICLPQSFSTTISTSAWSGFDTLITLETAGLPAGAVATFSPNPVTPGADALLTVDFPGDALEGTYNVQINGSAGMSTASVLANLKLVSNNFSAMSLLSPADGATGVSQSPGLHWVGSVDATLYEVQVASSPSFASGTIVSSNSNLSQDSFKVVNLLEKGKTYYWRVRPKNECGTGPWLQTNSFATLVENCGTYTATDLPKVISANSTPTVESKITVSNAGVVSDVNLKSFQGNHNFFKDLEVHLIGPGGEDVLLFMNKCPQSATFNLGFDDSAVNPFNCPPSNVGAYSKPAEALSIFNNKNANGEWTLRVKDNVINSGGVLSGFAIELCATAALNPPYIVNNNGLVVTGGTNAAITTDLLLVEDADNDAGQLVYTLVTAPTHGRLEKYWTGEMLPGAQFTQSELDNGAIRYFDYGQNQSDYFRFTVSDGNGGYVAGTFNIETNPLSASSIDAFPGLEIAPNPATDQVYLNFSKVLQSDTHIAIYNAAGQRMQSWVMPAGNSYYRLNLQDMPQGVYAITLENADAVSTRKIVIQ